MKYKIVIIFGLFLYTSCLGQNYNLILKIENLKNINQMPYIPELSGDSLYWTIIIEKLDIVPLLIEKLDDTTITLAEVPNFGGYYTVADIANTAITEIIKDVPVLEMVEVKDDRIGFGNYWNYTRSDFNNREKYKQRMLEWYQMNREKFIWNEDNRIYRVSEDWKFDNKHPAGGYYLHKN
jgi:hypothetical protein